MNNKTSRPTFSPEFKLDTAQLVVDGNYSTEKAEKAMNVAKSTMGKWVRQLKNERQGVISKGSALTPVQREIKELEKRIKPIELETYILKKATALLKSDSLSNLSYLRN